MKKNRPVAIFRYAKFGPAAQRRAYRVLKCRNRACGHMGVIVSQLHPPHGEWYVVVPADRPGEEQIEAFRKFERTKAVLDIDSGNFYWHKTSVDRFLK